METRTNWGIVAFASAFALLAIGVAASTAYFNNDDGGAAPIVIAEGVSNEPSGDWRAALASIAKPSVNEAGEYIAPAELGTTEALSRELIAKYLQLKGTDTYSSAEVQASVAELIDRNVEQVTAPTNYTLGNVKSSPNATLDMYAGDLGEALRPSTDIREYELVVFARAVGSSNFGGTAELVQSAQIYRTVEQDLLKMSVPNALATEHLALLQSVSMLAYTTGLLGKWSGDPIEALSYVDAFAKAERSVQVSLSALFAKISLVAKDS